MYLISFKDHRSAQIFVDYMAGKKVTIRIKLDQNGDYLLFLDNEDKLTFVRDELTYYLNHLDDPKYQEAVWQSGHNKKNHSQFLSMMPTIFRAGRLTSSITIVCVIIYLLLSLTSPLHIFAYLGFPFPNKYAQIWRFITPIFIHFSLLHILFNLTWWWYLGGMIERNLGWKKLIEITLVTGLISNYIQGMMVTPYFGGLSGVVYALMAYVWLYGELVKNTKVYFERFMLIMAIIWLIAGFTGLLGPTANYGHLSGLLVGLSLALKDRYLFNNK